MNVRYLAISFVFFLITIFFSCTKDIVPLASNEVICDTTSIITYSGNIQAIMNQNCVNCHNHNNANGGFEFDTYAGVAIAIPCGALLGSITHDPNCGYLSMPFDQPKMDDCSINKIRKWIHEGWPNN